MVAVRTTQLGWSLAKAAQSPPAVLTLRALRYVAEGHPGLLPALPGLRATAGGVPGQIDAAGGFFAWSELPPGPHRVLVTDPDGRAMPMAAAVTVAPPHPPRPTRAAPPAELAPPRLTLRLRPAPGRAIPPDLTAVIGHVRTQQGQPIALARLQCETLVDGRPARFVTWSARDGGYVLLLPGDDRSRAPLFRRLVAHRPTPALAAALAADVLAGMPTGLDTSPPEACGFVPATLVPHGADGRPAEAAPGLLPLRPGRTIRWDLILAH